MEKLKILIPTDFSVQAEFAFLMVKKLEEKSIFSCYHLHHKQVQGKEQHPTFYLYKHKDKPYHLDYCFASTDMIDKIQTVEIGDYDFWKQYSDHVPVMVTFDFK